MMRPVNTTILTARIEILTQRIEALRAAGYVLGQRIKVVKPAGTAGKPSKRKGYARVIDSYSGVSRVIAPDEVPEYQALIDRGRQVVRLQRQRSALVERVDRARIRA